MTEDRKRRDCPHTIPEFRAALTAAAQGRPLDAPLSIAEKLSAPAKGRSAIDVLTAPDAALK